MNSVKFQQEINHRIRESIMDVESAIKVFAFLDNYIEFEKETEHHFHEWKSIMASIKDDLPESLAVPKHVWGK